MGVVGWDHGRARVALCLWVAFLAACADVRPPEDAEDQINPIGNQGAPQFVRVPAGRFIMGSSLQNPAHQPDEVPHEVTLSRDFMMQTTEVTQAQWERLMGNNPSRFGGCPDCPVERVNRWDALAYLNALSEVDGLERCYVLQGCTGTAGVDLLCQGELSRGVLCNGWRLPTEAEWEYAARAGSPSDFYSGPMGDPDCLDEDFGRVAWFCGSAPERTAPVAMLSPNAFGLHDMHGNVYEWVQDLHAPYTDAPATDPVGPLEGDFFVLRGGGWFSLAVECRSAARSADIPGIRTSDVGFRPARTVLR